MWESQVLLTDGQVVFLRVLRFSPTFDERSARYKWNILERAIKPKSKKKKKKNIQYSDIFCWKNVSSFCKSYSHFFSKKFQHICVSLDVNFNESLTNDIVSFEQLGPALCTCHEGKIFSWHGSIQCVCMKFCWVWLYMKLCVLVCRLRFQLRTASQFGTLIIRLR